MSLHSFKSIWRFFIRKFTKIYSKFQFHNRLNVKFSLCFEFFSEVQEFQTFREKKFCSTCQFSDGKCEISSPPTKKLRLSAFFGCFQHKFPVFIINGGKFENISRELTEKNLIKIGEQRNKNSWNFFEYLTRAIVRNEVMKSRNYLIQCKIKYM